MRTLPKRRETFGPRYCAGTLKQSRIKRLYPATLQSGISTKNRGGVFNKIDYAMVTVSDMDRSVRFYRDALGLKLRFQSSEWTEFDTGTTTLALHGGGKPQARQGQDTEHAAGVASLGLNVADIDAAYRTLKERGVIFVMDPTVREGERIRLAVFVDPDGLPISIAQHIA